MCVSLVAQSLATREDLACLETRMTTAIGRVETTLHAEMTELTWRIVTLLAVLLPSLLAATVYVSIKKPPEGG